MSSRHQAMGVPRSFVIAVCLFGMASLGTDCGTAHFRFEIGGNVDSQVVFRLLDGHGRDITVKELIVVETCDPDKTTDDGIVWQIQGETRVHTIVYGEAPEGLYAKAGPLPLRREGRYSVAVHGEVSTLMRLRGTGTCEFMVEADGFVSGAEGCRLLSGQNF